MTGPTGAGAPVGLSVTVDQLSAALVALYADAERQLLDQFGRAVRDTLRFQLLSEMRKAAMRVATALALRSQPLTQELAHTAAQRGDTAAYAELRRIVEGDPRLVALYLSNSGGVSGHGAAAANQIGLELASKLDATRVGILRTADDAYRAAVAEQTALLVAGDRGYTPATAQTAAWRRLTDQGVTGFTDAAGRDWNLSSYVEMATRTATQRAYNAAAQARYEALGIQYFTVPHDGHPCPLCRPWEGAVLSNGRTGTVAEAHSITGAPVAFTVKATVEQARTAGLWHPNCRHTISPYLPGVTKVQPAKPWSKADQDRYDATQRLRELERQVRAAKRREQLARAIGDKAAITRARADQRRWQQRIREHVAEHDLVRRSRREQLDLGNK